MTPTPRRERPTGRRAGDSGTREAILDAALKLFAEHGFDGASLRTIAAEAGVDPALIRHFFGDKERLFVTAAVDRTTIPHQLLGALGGPEEQLGERVTRTYLGLWEDPESGPVLMALLRSAMTSERATQMLAEVLGGAAAALGTGEVLGTPEPRRVVLAASHLLGLAIARQVIRFPLLNDYPLDDLVADVAPTIQRCLAGADR